MIPKRERLLGGSRPIAALVWQPNSPPTLTRELRQGPKLPRTCDGPCVKRPRAFHGCFPPLVVLLRTSVCASEFPVFVSSEGPLLYPGL